MKTIYTQYINEGNALFTNFKRDFTSKKGNVEIEERPAKGVYIGFEWRVNEVRPLFARTLDNAIRFVGKEDK